MSCQDDPAKLCAIDEPCKVLSGSLALSTWLAAKKEEEKNPPKVVVVSPETVLGMGSGNENYIVDAAAETPEKELETFDKEEYTNSVAETTTRLLSTTAMTTLI